MVCRSLFAVTFRDETAHCMAFLRIADIGRKTAEKRKKILANFRKRDIMITRSDYKKRPYIIQENGKP